MHKLRWSRAVCLAIALLVMILMLFVVASGSDVEAAPGQEVEDHVTVEPTASILSFSVSGDILSWSISPASSPANTQGSLTISADSAWSVRVSSNNEGHMKAYFSANSSYGSKILKDPLKIRVNSATGYTGHTISLDEGGILVEGSGSFSGIIPFIYEQAVDWADTPLTYRIELTFETLPT